MSFMDKLARLRDVNGLALVLMSLVVTVAMTTMTEAELRKAAQTVVAKNAVYANADCDEI